MGNTKKVDPILLEKYLAITKSRKARRKRVAANQWIKTRKLPTDLEVRRKPPTIDDGDELDSALGGIGVIKCTFDEFGDPIVLSSNSFPTATTTINEGTDLSSDDFGTEIDDNLLIDCLLSNLDEYNLMMGQNNLDPNGIQQQVQVIDPQQSMDAMNELFRNYGDFELIGTANTQDFNSIQFTFEPPQESILSTTSPFPSSMSSPSIPSTSPEQQSIHTDEYKVPDVSSPSQQPRMVQPSQFVSPPPSSSASSQQQSHETSTLPPLQPSYGKDIFLLLNNRTNQSDSSDLESDSEYSTDSESEN